MPQLFEIGFVVAMPLALVLVMNTLTEWALLSREHYLELALAKSVKAIIIPALIAAYALIIAGTITGP